jgi:uncharacterized protein (TIGR02996 family)
MQVTHEEAFLQAIQETPDDDVPRLIFADWLDENDQSARAELIRLQCRLAGMASGDQERPGLLLRERALLDAHAADWLGAFHEPRRTWQYQRGTACLQLNGRRLAAPERLERAEKWFARAWVLELELHGAAQSLEALLGASFLSRLTVLRLEHARLGNEGARTVAFCPQLDRLTALSLRNNGLGTDGVRAVVRSPYLGRLEELDLAQSSVNHQGMALLASGLPRLRLLNLSEALSGPESVDDLLHADWVRNLTTLGLSSCRLGDGGARLLADCPGLAHLRELRVASNNVTPAGVAALAGSPHLAGLRRLDLRFNSIGSAGARFLARSSFLGHLEALVLQGDGVDSVGLEALRMRFGSVLKRAG